MNDRVCSIRHRSSAQQSHSVELIPAKRTTWGGRRRKLFKPCAAVFRAWLIQKFGHDFLLGGNVLDIAGGKGELAFELENLSGISTCVVDPRPLTLRSAYLKWKSGHYDKAASNPVFKNKFLTHYNPHDATPNYPQHLRVFFDNALIKRVLGLKDQNNDDDSLLKEWWTKCRNYAQKQCWTRKGLQQQQQQQQEIQHEEEKADKDSDGVGGGSALLPHEEDTTITSTTTTSNDNIDSWLLNTPNDDISDARTAISILQNCSLVIGMHPDQATEAVVDFALAVNKPSAVVPCCVFSSKFPNRYLMMVEEEETKKDEEEARTTTATDKNGNDNTTAKRNRVPVKTTSQLIDYLLQKDSRIQVETLGFEGMNRVVYMMTPQKDAAAATTASGKQ